MEDSLSHLEKYFKYASTHWSDIFNRNTSLSIPQVQNVLLKDWQKLTNPTNTQETKKNIKDKSVKTVPFFQHSIKNPYYSTSNEETFVEIIANKSNIDDDEIGQSEIKQKTTVEAEDKSESENEEMTLTEEDMLRLIKPAKRKTMMKKENNYGKKGSHSSAERREGKTCVVKKIKIATFEPEMTGKQAANHVKDTKLKTVNKKSWKPPFISVCWKIGCIYCEAKNCEVCDQEKVCVA